MGRFQKWIALGFVVGAMLVCGGNAKAGSLLNLTLGQPDIFSDTITVDYKASTHVLSAVGAAQHLSGSTATRITGDKFYLDALVNNSGNLINNTVNLQVVFGSKTWFKSGASTHTDLSLPNASPVSFGYGTGLMEFALSQNSFGQTGLVPTAGTRVGVKLHTSQAFIGSSFLSDFHYTFGTSDTAVVAAPVPRTSILGFAMFAALGTFAFVRSRMRGRMALAV